MLKVMINCVPTRNSRAIRGLSRGIGSALEGCCWHGALGGIDSGFDGYNNST